MPIDKKYDLGFIVGRFQVFHLGHVSLIEESLKLASKTIVLVGSADKKRIKDNPFSFIERKEFIHLVFPEVEVLPLDDIGVGNVPAWGDYLFDTIYRYKKIIPDLYVCGNEAKVDSWFDEKKREKLMIQRLSRDVINISASELRGEIIKDNKDFFLKYTPIKLHSQYEKIRQTLLSVYKE